MAEMAATFAASDTNGDGMLTIVEFEDFMTKLGQNATARGVPNQPDSEYSDEEKEQVYGHFNAVSADTTGVSMTDFFAVMGAMKVKMAELSGQ